MQTKLIVSIFLLLPLWLHAESEVITDAKPTQAEALNSFPYISGGVGLESRKALSQIEEQYNLKLEFTESTGGYLAGIDLQMRESITDKMVFNLKLDGPIFLAQLPANTYEITATFANNQKNETIVVRSSNTTSMVLYWKTAVIEQIEKMQLSE